MTQININICMDESLKKESNRFCSRLGQDCPNSETISAIDEVVQATQDPTKKLYTSFSELLQEVEADV